MKICSALVLVGFLGCANPGTDFRTTLKTDRKFEPRPDGHAIELFSEAPQRAHDEIAVLEGDDQNVGADGRRLLARMRAKARQLGGDAIVGFAVYFVSGKDKVLLGNNVSASQKTGFIQASGTVIRWRD